MEYEDEFERDFMRRTLRIVQDYSGPSDATLLLNCLVGLLIVPKERFLDRIPLDPLSSLQNWGISPSSIHEAAKTTKANPAPETLRGIVHSLRNAVAHSRFEPLHRDGLVDGFRFSDLSGFRAEIPVAELQVFVERLASHLGQE
jgi:hypothetical protein